MTEQAHYDDTQDAMLDSLLGAWKQAHQLPLSRADEIRLAARSSVPSPVLPCIWWSDFSRDLTDIVSHASRTWSSYQLSL